MMSSQRIFQWGVIGALVGVASAFAPPFTANAVPTTTTIQSNPRTSSKSSEFATATQLYSSNNNDNNIDDGLGERFGGYTVKQRLREEVESPFRKVRLVFFLSSVGSALTALYFSFLSTIKAVAGGFADAPPLEEALQSDAINLGAAIVCGVLAYREYNVGQANLQRIAKGGQLARLLVEPAEEYGARRTLKEYRRASRVVLAAGGPDYIAELSRALNSDQLADENTIPAALMDSDVVVIPILLQQQQQGKTIVVGDTRTAWTSVTPTEQDRNYDPARSKDVIAFPRGTMAWTEYLESELETAAGQGFDVIAKGFTITVKKNGRILRRATGQPPWADLIGTMEVLDGSKFGMPGDSEKYGGP